MSAKTTGDEISFMRSMPVSNDINHSTVVGTAIDPTQHIKEMVEEAGKLPNPKPKESLTNSTVGKFPIDAFPLQLQKLIEQASIFYQFRPDWLGSSILYATSVAVGNSLGIRLGDWLQKATLYVALVGRPGSNKSAPAEFAIQPIRRINAKAYKVFKEQQLEFDRWEKLNKKDRSAEGLPVSMVAPPYKTFLVSDVTQEALVKVHQDNLHGLGLFVDELSGWFQNFNRYSKGSDQQNWLSNWSFSPINVIRKTSAPIQIDHPFISVLGTIQPGILSEMAKDGRSQNGFIDRILFAYPDNQKKPYISEGKPDRELIDNYDHCINRLCSIRDMTPLNSNGAIDTRYLPFAPDAEQAMKEWIRENTDLSNDDNLPEAIAGIYAKLESYCVRFCLLVELLDYSCYLSDLVEISFNSVKRAILLAEYYRQNAEKVYSVLNKVELESTLSSTQQRLYDLLPGTITTAKALSIASQLTPPVSERTVKRLLDNTQLFNKLKHGEYSKLIS